MAKYTYKDGEVRTYKGVEIGYDLDGYHEVGYEWGYPKHWYITLETRIAGKEKARISRKYFFTLDEAKHYIKKY